jgi:hypothetical protein
VRQLTQFAEELDACGVVLRSATEPFDTGSPAGICATLGKVARTGIEPV